MRKKRHNSSTIWVVTVLLVIAFALHSFSHKEATPQELQAQPTAPQGEASWTVMPDSVVQMCMAAPLKKTPEVVLQRTSYVTSYNPQTRCPNWVAWQLTAAHHRHRLLLRTA